MEILKTALPYVISGISVGGQYALIAIGYTMVYGILRLINFAHGDVFMVAGLMMVYFATWMPLYLAIPLMIVLTVLLGFLIERVAYKPLRTAPRMSVMISAIGVSYLIQNLALYVTGGLNKNYPAIPWISDPVRLFGMETSRVTVITPFLTIALVIALVLLINHTKIGMAMRAVSKDYDTAQLMGIDSTRIIQFAFIISGILAGIAGVFLGMKYTLYPTLGSLVVKGFIASVIGGLGSLTGAVIGALLLGILETVLLAVLGSGYSTIAVFAVMLVFLLVRPQGIAGSNVQEKA